MMLFIALILLTLQIPSHLSMGSNEEDFLDDSVLSYPSKQRTFSFHVPMSSITTSSSSSSSSSSLPNESIQDDFTDLETVGRQFRAHEKRFRNCPSLRDALPNGRVKLRSYPNRAAKFFCNDGFDLFGNKFTTCSRNRWTHDLPICVSSNCSMKIPVKPPMVVRKVHNHGSVIDLSCELGYDLRFGPKNASDNHKTSGTSSSSLQPISTSYYPRSTLRAYCVGKKWLVDDWNMDQYPAIVYKRTPLQSLPECEIYEEPVNKSMKCDYEESLCGWFQDKEDDFDWIRNSHTTPSHYDDTGPSFDHTYGQNHSGYYLYLETSYPRSPNEKALLYSPVYQHLENVSAACFQFYYHMYGKAIGALRIYVKEKEQSLKELNPVWEMTGDLGDHWYLGEVEIEPSSKENLRPFQIIFEGVTGYGHQGDIAIDDISLSLGEKCSDIDADKRMKVITEPVPPDSDELELEFDNSTVAKDFQTETKNFTVQPTSSFGLFGDNGTDINDSPPADMSLNSIIRAILKLPPLRPRTKTTTTTTVTTVTIVPSNDHPSSSSTTASTTPKTVETVTKLTSSSVAADLSKSSKYTDLTTTWVKPTETKQTTSTTEISSGQPSTITTTITTSLPFSESLIDSDVKLKQADVGDRSATGNRFMAHGSIIFAAFCGLFLIIPAIMYLVYVNWPNTYQLQDYRFVAIFVNRCKIFQRNNHDDSEMLMVNDNNSSAANDVNPFHYNDSMPADDVVYLQQHH